MSSPPDAESPPPPTKLGYTVYFQPDFPVLFPSKAVAFRAVALYLYVHRNAVDLAEPKPPYGVEWTSDDVRALRRLFSNCLISREWAVCLQDDIGRYCAPDDESVTAGVGSRAYTSAQQLISLLDDSTERPTAEWLDANWVNSFVQSVRARGAQPHDAHHRYVDARSRALGAAFIEEQLNWFVTPPSLVPLERFERFFTGSTDFDDAVARYEANLSRALRISKALRF